MCLLHYTLLISELSSYYFCYKGFVQQPSLHPYVPGLCSENVCTETIFMALCFNIRGVDIVKLCFCINCCICLLYEDVCKYK